ncbi:MAG: hypothetical protein RI900_549 [Actinomycetota bacterium]
MRGRDVVRVRSVPERGQAVLLVAVVVVLAAASSMALARFGATLVLRQQAQAVADAVALAAVQGGEASARRVAEANGGTLVRSTTLGADVLVEVLVGGSRAVARATRAP